MAGSWGDPNGVCGLLCVRATEPWELGTPKDVEMEAIFCPVWWGGRCVVGCEPSTAGPALPFFVADDVVCCCVLLWVVCLGWEGLLENDAWAG